MRQRALIAVAGPKGVGKTTLIERVLSGSGESILSARCVRNDSLRRARETTPKTHQELRRYRDAGATGAALFAFPEADIGSDAFFTTHLMEDYSNAVLLEGDNPLGFSDLAVFVAPPPADGETLLVRRKYDRAKKERAKMDHMKRLLQDSDGLAAFLGQIMGGAIVEFARRKPKHLEETRAKMLASIAQARQGPVPQVTEHWAIAGGYEGIEHAQLVVLNVRNGGERTRCERLLKDLDRIRKDASVFEDVLGWRGSKVPITAVVANLANPSDAGTKKALARIRRAVRQRSAF